MSNILITQIKITLEEPTRVEALSAAVDPALEVTPAEVVEIIGCDESGEVLAFSRRHVSN